MQGRQLLNTPQLTGIHTSKPDHVYIQGVQQQSQSQPYLSSTCMMSSRDLSTQTCGTVESEVN